VAKDDGRIIGTQGMIPIYLNLRGTKHLTGKSENSLLEKSYRGGRIFQELYEFGLSLCELKGMCCVWGFTPAVKVWRDKLTFDVYEDVMHTHILVLDLKNALSKLSEILLTIKIRANMLYRILVILAYFYSSARIGMFNIGRKKERKRIFTIVTKLKAPTDILDLYSRLRAEYDGLIHIEHDETYFAWRITNNPNLSYATYFVYEGDLLKAYCYATTHNGIVWLSDFTLEDKESGIMLLKYLLSILSKSGIGYALFTGNVRNALVVNVLDLLRKCGFLELKSERTSFVLKNIACSEDLDVRNWYMNGLWTEGYQW
jgi:hypothetical protein